MFIPLPWVTFNQILGGIRRIRVVLLVTHRRTNIKIKRAYRPTIQYVTAPPGPSAWFRFTTCAIYISDDGGGDAGWIMMSAAHASAQRENKFNSIYNNCIHLPMNTYPTRRTRHTLWRKDSNNMMDGRGLLCAYVLCVNLNSIMAPLFSAVFGSVIEEIKYAKQNLTRCQLTLTVGSVQLYIGNRQAAATHPLRPCFRSLSWLNTHT